MIIHLLTKTVKQALSLVLNRYRFKAGIWLLWMVLLGIGQQAWAQDDQLGNMSRYSATHNSDGSVTFKLLFYDDNDEDEFVTTGKVLTEKQKDDTQILYFESWNQSENNYYKARVTPQKGTGVFTDNKGNEIVVKPGNTQEITFAREENRFAYIHFTWYYSNDFEGKQIRFLIDENNDHAANVDWQPFGNTITFKSFQNPTLTDPTLSTESGKYQMSYTTGQDPIKIWNTGSDWKNSTATNGTLSADIQETKRDYTFKVIYRLNKYYESKQYSVTKTLPAYHQAKNFKATDIANGDTKLTWNIANNESNCQNGDAFEIQRSNDESFASPTSIGQVAFSYNKTNYEFIDETGDLNINGPIYYRIRRTKQPLWNWGLSSTCNITKTMSHQEVISASAAQHEWDGSQQAKISWTLEEKNNNKVWTKNAQIVVKKYMDYGSGNIKSEEMIASEEDIQRRYLIDDLNVSCVNYTLSLIHISEPTRPY